MAIDMGLYDSANGKSLEAAKVVDVSNYQTKPQDAHLLFTKAERGRIVQVRVGGVADGSRIHYFLDEEGGKKMMDEDSERFGFEPGQLRVLAEQHAPA